MKKKWRTVWVNCEFCLLAFETNEGRIRIRRGVFCSRPCTIHGRILQPFNPKIIEKTLRYRDEIRARVHRLGLDKIPHKAA